MSFKFWLKRSFCLLSKPWNNCTFSITFLPVSNYYVFIFFNFYLKLAGFIIKSKVFGVALFIEAVRYVLKSNASYPNESPALRVLTYTPSTSTWT